MRLECLHCYEEYEWTKDSPEYMTMYCSQVCEELEDLRLKTGNAIIARAEQENPQAFAQSKAVGNIAEAVQGIIQVLTGSKEIQGASLVKQGTNIAERPTNKDIKAPIVEVNPEDLEDLNRTEIEKLAAEAKAREFEEGEEF